MVLLIRDESRHHLGLRRVSGISPSTYASPGDLSSNPGGGDSSNDSSSDSEAGHGGRVPHAVNPLKPHLGLDRDLVLRRASNVRQLLPLELQPYILPGCVSSISPSTYASPSAFWEHESDDDAADAKGVQAGLSLTSRRKGGKRLQHHLVFVRSGEGLKRASSDPQLNGESLRQLEISLA